MTLARRTAAAWSVAGRKLEGTVVRFGVEADLGPFRERVAPGAFDDVLRRGLDVQARVDHDPSALLGRTKSGTLRLHTDAVGLHFALDVPDTSLGRDVLVLAERGDLSGMSFGFEPPGASGTIATRIGDVRELQRVALREITIVTGFTPAYPETSVVARTSAAAAWRRRYLETV